MKIHCVHMSSLLLMQFSYELLLVLPECAGHIIHSHIGVRYVRCFGVLTPQLLTLPNTMLLDVFV